MKILTFSTLFPNAEKPSHCGFAGTRVVAPVAWFPSHPPKVAVGPRHYVQRFHRDDTACGRLYLFHLQVDKRAVSHA